MNKLSIPSSVNIGLEMEVNGITKDEMIEIIKEYKKYKVAYDNTIALTGSEIVSPIIHNKVSCLKELKSLLETVDSHNHSFDDCAFQINFDLDLIKKKENIIYLLKLLCIYEDVIFHFSLGEETYFRDTMEIYASPIKDWMLEYYKNPDDIEFAIKHFSNTKLSAVNFKVNNKKFPKPLIEYRSMNGTLNYDLILSYINFFYYLTTYVNKSDKELIDHKFDKLGYTTYIDSYYLKRMKKAEELANLIFKNESDKQMFLSDYEHVYCKKMS